jgi:hypothetical protein
MPVIHMIEPAPQATLRNRHVYPIGVFTLIMFGGSLAFVSPSQIHPLVLTRAGPKQTRIRIQHMFFICSHVY